jgi:predicted MPP superfamily phosphohydrolase
MFHVLFGMPCLYAIVRFVWPMPWTLSAKIAAALVLLLASQYHLYCRFSSGSVFSPEFPRLVVIFFNWAFGVVVLIALLQILTDIVSIVLMLIQRQPIVIAPGVRYAIGVGALLLSALGVQQAIRVPPVKDIEISIRHLPPQFDGYTMLQLTDLHISRLFDAPWTQAVVNDAMGLKADLIVVTGDLIDGSISSRRQDVEALRQLSAPDGVWFIPGNHEYFFEYEAWMRYFTAMGMQPLQNSHTLITRDGASFVLAGVTDLSAPKAGFPAPDLKQALAGAPANAPIILLDHQPRNARVSASQGVSLQLSGHTHGGMILGVHRLLALANAGFVSGLYDVDGMQLYVNNGTALWPGFALRLGKPSELTRITLRRALD